MGHSNGFLFLSFPLSLLFLPIVNAGIEWKDCGDRWDDAAKELQCFVSPKIEQLLDDMIGAMEGSKSCVVLSNKQCLLDQFRVNGVNKLEEAIEIAKDDGLRELLEFLLEKDNEIIDKLERLPTTFWPLSEINVPKILSIICTRLNEKVAEMEKFMISNIENCASSEKCNEVREKYTIDSGDETED